MDTSQSSKNLPSIPDIIMDKDMSQRESEQSHVFSQDDDTNTSIKMGQPKRSILKQPTLSQLMDSQSLAENIKNGNVHNPDDSLKEIGSSKMEHSVDDNNTTSRIHTLNKTNRRVSFAPDVTLHSFDFIVSSTQNNNTNTKTSNTLPPVIKPQLYNQNHQITHNEEDLSTSMELTEPINITKNNDKIQVVNEDKEDMSINDIGREEKMSPIPLSINSEEMDMNDSTMELTETVKPIQSSNTQEVDYNDSAMELTGPIKPISSIVKKTTDKVIDHDQTDMDFTQIRFNQSNNNANDIVDNEDMDFTQVRPRKIRPGKDDKKMDFTQTRSPSVHDNNTNTDIDLTKIKPHLLINKEAGIDLPEIKVHHDNTQHNNTEEMDFTQIRPQLSTRVNTENMDLTQVKPHTTSKVEDEMDLTEVKLPISTYVIHNDTDMDLTQTKSHPIKKKEDITDTAMDLSQVKPRITENVRTNEKDSTTIDRNEDNNDDSMELTNVISTHGLNTTQDEISSKRKFASTSMGKEEENQRYNQNKAQSLQNPVVSDAERMSPIRYEEFNDNNIVDQAPPSVDHISLTKFLNDIQSNFVQETNNLKRDVNPISIQSTLSSNTIDVTKKAQLFTALYSDIPWFQMNTFMCKELITMSNKSQQVFDDLKRQISNSSIPTPLLIQEYYNSSTSKKEEINKNLRVLKSYSYLEARKTWYKWQLSNLDNVKLILNENLDLLKERQKNIHGKITKIKDVDRDTQALKASIKQDILKCKHRLKLNDNNELSLDNKIKLAKMKKYMELQKVNLKELPGLMKTKDELTRKVAEMKENLTQLQESAEHINATMLKRNQITHNKLQNKLVLLQNITSVKFIKVTEDTVTFSIPMFPPLVFSIKLTETCGEFISKTLENLTDPFSKIIFENYFKTNYNPKTLVKEVMTPLIIGIRDLVPVIRQFSLLRTIFITHIRNVSEDGECVQVIELKQYDWSTETTVRYHIPIMSFKQFIESTSEHILIIKAFVEIGKQSLSTSELEAMFSIQTRHVIPVLKKDNIKVVLNSV